MSGKSSDDGIHVLIGIFLNHNAYIEVVEDVSVIISDLILYHEDILIISHADNKNSFNVPYHKIADAIFRHNESISSESLENFVSAVYSAMLKKQSEKIVTCYNKFTRHILLAVRQKNFINEISEQARHVANEAGAAATKAHSLAEDTEKEIKNSVVNYITILGIFTTIIFALFGASNLISSVGGLLGSANRPRLSTIVFLMSILIAFTSTFLIIMMTWLSEVKGLGEKKMYDRIYLRIYIFLLLVCLVMSIVSSIVLLG
ncbi:hypothetical protein HCY66_06105 [Acinetobacter radioresistens]|uniref:hypothetical protein n=1 Tax=Acinetobacter radioresistens TaxID=40216 RepID=UPI002003678E|nr:hypothetical protein [Acinetobacter radioresistens]MCK4089658.1 hypothetical protein [Acinetobacter radioresistens]